MGNSHIRHIKQLSIIYIAHISFSFFLFDSSIFYVSDVSIGQNNRVVYGLIG